MYVMVDHYDSYVYNLVREFQILGAEVKPVRSDCADFESLERLHGQKKLQGLIPVSYTHLLMWMSFYGIIKRQIIKNIRNLPEWETRKSLII